MSQLIVVMMSQFRPVGQQMADFLLLKGMHTVDVGQQKSSGSPSWLQGTKPLRAHVMSLGRSPTACATCSAAESVVTEGTMVETRHAAASLGKVIRPMVILVSRKWRKFSSSQRQAQCTRTIRNRES